ncbi:uncharacterized protein METZ01_LOCUS154389 [marine metagenome]|uniref:Uncharacterized protein n=1 Tax=marine metagenome TaxID=408172 RepID=A0A382AIX9_9ZZZZ
MPQGHSLHLGERSSPVSVTSRHRGALIDGQHTPCLCLLKGEKQWPGSRLWRGGHQITGDAHVLRSAPLDHSHARDTLTKGDAQFQPSGVSASVAARLGN